MPATTVVILDKGVCMSYVDHSAAFAPASGIQELSSDEIGAVNGCGFWESVGEAADSPWRSAGRFVDFMIDIHWVGTTTYRANGIRNIK